MTPTGIDLLTEEQKHNPDAIVWKGDQDIPVSQQGMKVLGVPVGRDEHATRFPEEQSEHHDALFQRIPLVPDVQACWLLLSFCAATRTNFYLRNVSPEIARSVAISHDTKVHHWLCQIVGVDPDDVRTGALQQSKLPFHLGGLGLASAVRSREGAHWASWADSVATVSSKNLDLGAIIVDGLNSRAGNWAETDFGQIRPTLASRGVDRLWPNRLWPILVF